MLRGRSDEAAIAHYREAAEIAPDRPAAPHQPGRRSSLREDRLDEALAAYARALGRAPRDEAALEWTRRGLACRRAGAVEAAEIARAAGSRRAGHDRAAVPSALVTLRTRGRAAESSRARRRQIEAPLRSRVRPRPMRSPASASRHGCRAPAGSAREAAAAGPRRLPAEGPQEPVASEPERPSRRPDGRRPSSWTRWPSDTLTRRRPAPRSGRGLRSRRPPPSSSTVPRRPQPRRLPARAWSVAPGSRHRARRAGYGSTSTAAGATERPRSCCCSTGLMDLAGDADGHAAAVDRLRSALADEPRVAAPALAAELRQV